MCLGDKVSRCATWGGVRKNMSEAEALHACLSKVWDVHDLEENAANWVPGESRPSVGP